MFNHLANRTVVEDVPVSVVLQTGCAGQEEFCRFKSNLFERENGEWDEPIDLIFSVVNFH